MKVKILFSFIFSALISSAVFGQARAPHSMYFMETIPQISQFNPALQPRTNVYISLPGVGIDFHSDIAIKDVLQRHGDNYFTPVEDEFDYKKFYNATGKSATMINVGVDIDLLGFGFRTGKGYFSFGMSEHAGAKFALPTDLFKIPEKFFPDQSEFNLSPLRVEAKTYLQFRVGYSHQFNEKLTIGMNVKPLFGQMTATTKFDNFHLKTGINEWIIESKGKIHTSAPVEIIRDDEGKISVSEERLDELQDMIDAGEWAQLANRYFFNGNNFGIALDLGAAYQITERLSVSAALNNIGFIAWNRDLSGANFGGEFTFDNRTIDLNLADYLNDNDKLNELLDEIGDDIFDDLEFQPYDGKFRTSPPPVLYAGASYLFNSYLSAGFLSRTTFWQNAVRQSFNLSVNLQPYSFVALTTGATWQVKGNVYLGGGLTFFLGPLQIYLVSDYVPVRYSTLQYNDTDIPFIPERQKTIYARLGFNLVFGKHGYRNRPMLDTRGSSWQ